MTIICIIILFITLSFLFLNAFCISKVPGHYINHKIKYSTARTAVVKTTNFQIFSIVQFSYAKRNTYLKLKMLIFGFVYCFEQLTNSKYLSGETEYNSKNYNWSFLFEKDLFFVKICSSLQMRTGQFQMKVIFSDRIKKGGRDIITKLH